jgi:hypothetical protein
MPKAGTFKLAECIAHVEQHKKNGLTWNEIAATLCISYNQVLNIASRIGIRQSAKPVKTKAIPAPQPIPRGVPTLPPLPSLQEPLATIKFIPDDNKPRNPRKV